MKLFNNKIFIAILPAIFFAIFGISTVSAQPAGGNCDIISASFDTSRQPGGQFYIDENRPFVYINLQTQNCIGESIQVSITEDDSDPDDDVNGNIGSNDPCNTGNTSCMDNRIISINANTTSEFTLALVAGEDECDDSASPDCDYHIETWDEVNSGYEWPGDLEYNCDEDCEETEEAGGTWFWEYKGWIPFETTHADDPDDEPGEDSDPGPDDDTDVGADDDADVSSSSGTSGPIDLNLPNPLAGTIDTLPEFFRKLIDIIIKIAIPLIAIAIVYSGLLFVTARGNEEQLKTAKNTFLFAVIGGLILLASWLIAEAIKDALTTLDD